MMVPSALHFAESMGASDRLVSALASVIDATGPDGPRYPPRATSELVRLISARAFGRPMLELAHALRFAAELSPRRSWPTYFWGAAAASPSSFRAVTDGALARAGRRPDPPPIEARTTAVAWIGESAPFEISYGRLPLLTALLELMVDLVGFEPLDAVALGLTDRDRGEAVIREAANALSRLLYEALRDHLPAGTAQRRCLTLLSALRSRVGVGFGGGVELGPEHVDDEFVLEHWSATAAEAGEDNRTFTSFVASIARLRTALEYAKTRSGMRRAAPIGGDHDAGETDIAEDAVLGVLEEASGMRDALDALSAPSAGSVKFLNKREVESITLLADCGRQVLALPLSMVRAAVFGDRQSQLLQAVRRRLPDAEVTALVDERHIGAYAERCERWRGVIRQIDVARRAALHVLIVNRRPAGAALMAELEPEVASADLPALAAGAASNVVSLRGGSLAGRVVDALATGAGGERVDAVLAAARRIHGRVSRKGFEAEKVEDPETVAAFEASAPVLGSIGGRLASFLAVLDPALGEDGGAAREAEDHTWFAVVFRALYAARDGGARSDAAS